MPTERNESVPRSLLTILSDHNASNIRPIRLTGLSLPCRQAAIFAGLPAEASAKAGVLHYLGIVTRCHLRCFHISKAAIALQHGSPRTFSVNGVV